MKHILILLLAIALLFGCTGGLVGNNDNFYIIDQDGNVEVPIVFNMYDPKPIKNTETEWNGGIQLLSGADTLGTGNDIIVTKGTGKILFVVQDSSDAVGTVIITGDSVNRNTGAIIIGDTETITMDGNSTDNSYLAGKGNAILVHDFNNAYITSKWFTGVVTISTTEVTLIDVDVWHFSFEQVNDQPYLVLNTFDASLFTTNVSAEFDAYLYTLHKNGGDSIRVDNEVSLHIGTDGETAIANKYWRLRKGNIDENLNGETDGFWVDVWYLNSGNPYIEDLSIKVWFTETHNLNLS